MVVSLNGYTEVEVNGRALMQNSRGENAMEQNGTKHPLVNRKVKLRVEGENPEECEVTNVTDGFIRVIVLGSGNFWWVSISDIGMMQEIPDAPRESVGFSSLTGYSGKE